MTDSEFREWFAYHRASFPAIDSWLGRIDKNRRGENPLTAVDILKRWKGVLADASLQDAKEATDALMRGDDPEPKSFDEHPRAVRRIAKRLSGNKATRPSYSPAYCDGEPTFRCRECLDQGIIIVWHWIAVKAASDGRLGQRLTEYSCAVRCRCDEGFRRRSSTPVMFDESLMLRCDYHPTDNNRQELLEFVRPKAIEWNPGSEF